MGCPGNFPGMSRTFWGCSKSLRKKSMVIFQERTRHINLRKIPGHRPGVPGTPGGTNRGLPAGVPEISCCLL